MYAGWEMDPDFFIATLQCLKKKWRLQIGRHNIFRGIGKCREKIDFFFIFGMDNECNISCLGKWAECFKRKWIIFILL